MARKFLAGALSAVAVGIGASQAAHATETPAYEAVLSEGAFEVRDYAPELRAEVTVVGSRGRANSRGFWPLFQYISGANDGGTEIAMTAPVARTRSGGAKIPMTAPVASVPVSEEAWTVSFFIGAPWTYETAPRPTNPAVQLRQTEPRRMAVLRFSGNMNDRLAAEKLTDLYTELDTRRLTPDGLPEIAGYDAPGVPGRLRRNEVMVPILVDDPAT